MEGAVLALQLLFGAAGAAYFIYGKKQRATIPFVCGLILMAFPYFVSSAIALTSIGVALMAIPYFLRS